MRRSGSRNLDHFKLSLSGKAGKDAWGSFGTSKPPMQYHLAEAGNALGAPSEGLNCDPQIFFETDGIHDMPAVHTKALLALVQPIGLITWGSPRNGVE